MIDAVYLLGATSIVLLLTVLGLGSRLGRLERDLAWAQRDALVGVARSARLEHEVAAVRNHLKTAEARIKELAERVLKPAFGRGRKGAPDPQDLARRLREAAASLEAATAALDHVGSSAGPPSRSASSTARAARAGRAARAAKA